MDRLLTIMTVFVAVGVAVIYGPRFMEKRGAGTASMEDALPEPSQQLSEQPQVPGPRPGPSPAPTPPASAPEPGESVMPDSIATIRRSTRTYKIPESEILTVFRGYYEAAPGKLRRIQINNTGDRTIKIEQSDGRERELKGQAADFEVFNFNGDPRALIFEMSTATQIFVKFRSKGPVPGYQDPNVRRMVGWLIEANGTKPMALIEGKLPELESIKTKGEYVWPAASSCQALFPGRIQ